MILKALEVFVRFAPARFLAPVVLAAGLLTAGSASAAMATPAPPPASPPTAVCGGADGTVRPANDPYNDCANPTPATCGTNGSLDNPNIAVLGRAPVFAPSTKGKHGAKIGTVYQLYSRVCKGVWTEFIPKGGSQPQYQVFVEIARTGGPYPISAPYTSPSAFDNVFSSYLEATPRTGGHFASRAYAVLNGVAGPTAYVP